MSDSLFEGFDNNTGNEFHNQSELGQKLSNISLWLILSIVTLLFITVASIYLSKDLKLFFYGNRAVAEFKVGTKVVGRYMDSESEEAFLVDFTERSSEYYNRITKKGSSCLKGSFAAFKDSNNNVYIVELSNKLFSKIGDGKVNVYYFDGDCKNARVLTPLWFWVIVYFFLLSILIIFVGIIYKELHVTKHYVGSQDNLKMKD